MKIIYQAVTQRWNNIDSTLNRRCFNVFPLGRASENRYQNETEVVLIKYMNRKYGIVFQVFYDDIDAFEIWSNSVRLRNNIIMAYSLRQFDIFIC